MINISDIVPPPIGNAVTNRVAINAVSKTFVNDMSILNRYFLFLAHIFIYYSQIISEFSVNIFNCHFFDK